MTISRSTRKHVIQDALIILASIGVAVLLVKYDTVIHILNLAQNFEWIGSFIAGLFFTSIFTTAPAIVALGEIAATGSILQTAFIGAAGAVMGDWLLFRFVRDRFSGDIKELLEHRPMAVRIRKLSRMRAFRSINLVVGAIIIASPFPDELGISLLGFNHLSTLRFALVSYVCNFIGIILIGLAARSL